MKQRTTPTTSNFSSELYKTNKITFGFNVVQKYYWEILVAYGTMEVPAKIVRFNRSKWIDDVLL